MHSLPRGVRGVRGVRGEQRMRSRSAAALQIAGYGKGTTSRAPTTYIAYD